MTPAALRLRPAAVLVCLALAGCTAAPAPDPEPTPRPVSSEEAQLLAIARFTNYDRGSRPFSTVVLEDGVQLTLTGWVDYGAHLGFATVAGDFAPQALLWTDTTVGIRAGEPDPDGNPVLPIPDLADQGWQSHRLDGTASDLELLLTTIGNLGSDRPDNPLLLQQSGAFWLRADTLDGTAVTVFASPPSDQPADDADTAPTADDSPLRLWVDAHGLILRAEVRIAERWTTVEFPDREAPRLELPGGTG
ncbi:hypothetical protein [Protaetiibacter larvae]|uniref:LppX_LprAFG lipoprotein n=1 Tax=Protaetiibacter larvae TaxID=2592654 RepID=A0A5C1Y626_9MICO|nr:hypothetical protein [Protaetiibacter larvae]QEO09241.1 hypothetical protein FLP23_03960 [Protaetiibacter larvae]